MTITTNNHWREFKYGHEVPTDVIESNDHLDMETDGSYGWINYRGHWYHVSDFLRLGGDWVALERKLDDWHGYSSDSFFSGVLIRLSNDGQSYQIATYTS